MKTPVKTLLLTMALCAATAPALAQTNVSISVGQPGFYGRIDIGDYVPRPVVYAPQPVIIAPAPAYVEPVYLRVPPGHRKHWARFCGRYNACNRPVLFVRDDWYTNTYVPVYREHHGAPRTVVVREPVRVIERQPVRVVERVEYRDGDRGHGHGRGHDEDRGEGHGEGHGHGHGHGHDRD